MFCMSKHLSPWSTPSRKGKPSSEKTIKVMILGVRGVGKTSLISKFITNKFYQNYNPTKQEKYTFRKTVDNSIVYFDILDSGKQSLGEELNLETNIKWADAFILMYSVTNKHSYDECYRLKFLVNFFKRRHQLGSSLSMKPLDIPVILVANKTDKRSRRMVSVKQGLKLCGQLGCVSFHEISLKKRSAKVNRVFEDIARFWRLRNKNPHRRSLGEFCFSPDPDPVRRMNLLVSPQHSWPTNGRTMLIRRWTTRNDLSEDYEDQNEAAALPSTSRHSPPSLPASLELRYTAANLLEQLRNMKW